MIRELEATRKRQTIAPHNHPAFAVMFTWS